MADDTRSDNAQPGGNSAFQPTVITFSRDGGKTHPSSADFISAAPSDTITETVSETAVKEPSASGRGWRLILGLVLSTAWIMTGASYMVWSGLTPQAVLALSPLEAILSATAFLMPLMVLWLLLALTDRNTLFRTEALAIRHHLALLTYPAEASERHIATLSDAIRAQTQYLSNASQDAATQAETLRTALARESRDLARIADHIEKESTATLARVTERIHALGSLMEQIQTLSETMDNTLRHHQENLIQAAEKTQHSSETLCLALERQHGLLRSAASDANHQATILETLAQRQERGLAETQNTVVSFTRAGETMTHVISKVSDFLSAHVTTLDQVVGHLDERGERLGERLERLHTQGERLEAALCDKINAFEEYNRKLAETARYTCSEISTATVTIINELTSLRDRTAVSLEGTHQVSSAIRDTTDQMGKAHLLLEKQTTGLVETADRLSTALQEAGSSVQEQQASLIQTTERSSERIRHISDLLARNAVDITRTSARASVEIETVAEGLKATMSCISTTSASLQGTSREITQAVEDTSGRLNEVTLGLRQGAEAFCDETDRIVDASHIAAETLDSLSRSVRAEAGEISQVYDQIVERMKQQTDALQQKLESFHFSLDSETHRTTHASTQLHAALGAITTDAKRSFELLSGASGGFRAQIDALSGITEKTVEQLEDATRRLKEEGEDLAHIQSDTVQNAHAAAKALAQVTEELAHSARDAEQHAHDLKKAQEAVHIKRFLSECSYIVERLQAAAVDITRLFSPNTEEDLWQRFYKGEQNIFLRQAARSITRAQISAVRRLYSENKEFRQYATRYINEYESILKAARGNDRADILIAIFTGSDMGRLYAVLSKTLSS